MDALAAGLGGKFATDLYRNIDCFECMQYM